jgi:membrane-associated phospholipid phosphatase
MKTLSVLGALLCCALLAGCGDEDNAAARAVKPEPSARSWKPWVLSSPGEIAVAPPPRAGSAAAARDDRVLRETVRARTPAQQERLRRAELQPVVQPWLGRAMALVSQREKNPPAASRAYGLVSVAMYDAAVAAYHWMYRYDRKAPDADAALPVSRDPSYPSDHAAIAGAASRVLAYLYPEVPAARFDLAADDAAQDRVLAGVSRPSDVEAGLKLGRAVGERIIAHAKRDGSTRKWDGKRPRGEGHWEPPPGSLARPVEPLAGTWGTWVLKQGDQLRPGPPPAYRSAKFRAEATEVANIGKTLTAEQKRIALFWSGGQGTPLPPGVWNQVMFRYVRAKQLSVPRLTRVFALLNVAMADAGVASWDAKFAYWNLRPINVIRSLGIDRDWKPLLDTPFFPAYVSGHATYSAAAGEVLAHLFPEDAKLWREKADEAAISRLYGGIHYRSDSVVGARMGREIGHLTVRHAETDGAES